MLLLLLLTALAEAQEMVAQPELTRAFEVHVSPDGRYLGVTGQGVIYDLQAQGVVANLGALEEPATFSIDGRRFAGVRTGDNTVVVARVPAGRVEYESRPLPDLTTVALDGDLLALGFSDGKVQLRNISGVKPPVDLPEAHLNDVTCMAFDQGRLLTGSADGTVRLWRLPDLQPVGVLRHYLGGLHKITVREGVIYTLTSTKVRAWDAATLRLLAQIPWEGTEWAFQADGTLVLSGSADDHGKIVRWSLNGQARSRDLPWNTYVTAFSPDGEGYFDHQNDQLVLRSLENDTVLRDFSERAATSCMVLEAGSDGARFITRGVPERGQSSLSLWSQGAVVRSLSFPRYAVDAMATNGAQNLAAFRFDRRIGVIQLEKDEWIASWPSVSGYKELLEFLPDGRLVDGKAPARVLEPTTGRIVRTLGKGIAIEELHGTRAALWTTEAFSFLDLATNRKSPWFREKGATPRPRFSEELVFLDRPDEVLVRRNPTTGQELASPPAPDVEGSWGLLNWFNPDGSLVVRGGWLQDTFLWRTSDWSRFSLAMANAEQIAFDPAGTRVAGVSETALRVWDLQGQPLASIPWQGAPASLAFHPDGRHLFVTTRDDLWHLFDLTSQRLLLTGLSFVNSNDWAVLTPDGHYDGSVGGLGKAFVRKGDEVVRLCTLDPHAYVGGLIPACLR